MSHVTVVPYAEEYKTLDHVTSRLNYLRTMVDFVRITQGSSASKRYSNEIYDTECQLLEIVSNLTDNDGLEIDKLFFRTDNFGFVSKGEAKNILFNLNRLQ